ncbi:amino acid permease [Cyberlindnera jadinii NRRL Y-1542]|uniref:Amino acid permease n=1 Tax=Cyberlindnera jadinii (strain ATCC 18201 / CBS 1600 / BCRC 20928 / JCM 3617 / NBRC 0987 / NRRL Y-1542) TaxID=983966 RepID=A0A1E4S8B1_CYBJN|nr:amino acid permease [Cyberlindnera jadinii NRRL Y-1542]ODV75632.1 amino acid permease [Cyberlindnera jadinii NRRL Y-1542]
MKSEEDSGSFHMTAVSETNPQNDTRWRRFKDSFKKMDDDIDPSLSEAEKAQIREARNEGEKLKKGINRRHMFLIAVATGIGTGLLVGSGSSLHNGGPAGLIIGIIVVGSMLIPVMEAAGEMAVTYADLTGGFNAYSSILVDSSLCFAVSWNYCIQWLCVMPLELVTASMTIKYWNETINPDAFIAIFYTVIVIANFIGSDGYAEFEFFLNTSKVLMILGFSILCVILICGGASSTGYIGAKYWHNPGAFANSFKGVCAVFVNAAFSLGCTEFLAFSAAEQPNPRRSIPSATKQVVYRIVFLFVIPLFLIGLLVPYNSPDLLGASGSQSHTSPFVIAVSQVNVVPHIVNAVILLAVLSVGNSAMFCSSRTLQSLAEQGMAPSFFNYIDRTGRPIRCLIFSAVCGIFSFIAAYEKQEEVFDWLLAISGLSTILTWSTIVLCHIRFRKALAVQGFSTSELGYRSKTGVLGSWYAFTINVLILMAQFWIALFPIGENGKADAENFFQNYLGMVVAIVFYLIHKVYHKNWRLFRSAEEIDLVRGRKIFDADVIAQENAEDAEQLRNSPLHVRIARFWC